MSDKSRNINYDILDKILYDKLPPMENEPNQEAVDAEQARILRETTEARKTTNDIEKFLRS